MIEVRPFASLGHADHGWLQARHHFSFASYHDPARLHWGRLRVWNDDHIAAGSGFPPHPHQDMEIITYVRQGAISHRDHLGNRGRTVAGDVQVMSAGRGIEHAEYNFEDGPCELFQIWILPEQRGGEPSWGTRPFPRGERAGQFVTLASGFAGDSDALPIRTPARLLAATLPAGQTLEHPLADGQLAYLVASQGRYRINGIAVEARDGVAIKAEPHLLIEADSDSELVLVELTG